LDPQRHTLCVCEHGVRSEAAAAFLAGQGFARVATMRGGMACWPGPVERG
jgi:rhodanese-related sulfurtransferase